MENIYKTCEYTRYESSKVIRTKEICKSIGFIYNKKKYGKNYIENNISSRCTKILLAFYWRKWKIYINEKTWILWKDSKFQK